MYSDISQFEPLMPADVRELEDRANVLVESSAVLAGSLPPETLSGVRDLLRKVNSYYSNLIEGHNTHPIDVEKAMARDYSSDPVKRDLQKESSIHIELQKKIETRLNEDPELDITDPNFLLWLHKEFYEQMPEDLRWVRGGETEREWVNAGEFRKRQVVVGDHLPPTANSLDLFLERFHKVYEPSQFHGVKPVIALAAAHHRLMWIHPFLDGNGRVVRLFTDAYFYRIGMAGYGLWNVSRGFARNSTEYKKYLAAADLPRRGDLDGRGNLSNKALTDFCLFLIETCIDQAKFMGSLLSLGDFLKRMEHYMSMRTKGLLVDERGVKIEPLHPRAGIILREAAINGSLTRRTVFDIIGMSDRSGRNVLRSLLTENLLIPQSNSPKSHVRLGFPAHAAGYWFPKLYPDIE